jgi:nucleotide-binding universal stress UspA family protein
MDAISASVPTFGERTFTNILVGVDGRQGGRDAVTLARQLAAPGAVITFANLFSTGGMPGPGAERRRTADHRAATDMLRDEATHAGLDANLVAAGNGAVGRGLHQLASDMACDLLVVGISHHGLVGRALAGDDSRATLNGAPCAVAIAPERYAPDGPIARIGLGHDGSAEADAALAAARALAQRHGATISALSVVSMQMAPVPVPERWSDDVPQLLDAEQQRLAGLAEVAGVVRYGEPAEELEHFSEELDLLVVGARGHGAMGRLMHGSTSNYLARRAHCPLLVLPRT